MAANGLSRGASARAALSPPGSRQAMNRHLHTTHDEVIKRLRRAAGHLGKVISMIEQGDDCLRLAQQLHAVEKAIVQAKKILIHDHLDHCLEHAVDASTREARASIEEFKEITKYLDR